jgi:hypothetical protein
VCGAENAFLHRRAMSMAGSKAMSDGRWAGVLDFNDDGHGTRFRIFR